MHIYHVGWANYNMEKHEMEETGNGNWKWNWKQKWKCNLSDVVIFDRLLCQFLASFPGFHRAPSISVLANCYWGRQRLGMKLLYYYSHGQIASCAQTLSHVDQTRLQHRLPHEH